MNEFSFKSSISLLPDINRTPLKQDGSHVGNFNRFVGGSPFSRRLSVSPIKESEKDGPKWFSARHKSV
jgi:hypothetical protein